MGLLNYSFGKKRRSVKRSSKAARKPPARLLKICKKYRVKATKKVGSKRVYKSVKVLKKLCLKKAMALRKKLMKKHKPKAHRRRSMGFGSSMLPDMNTMRNSVMMPAFGKKTGRKVAMKAFRSFYKRHCAGRRSGFGSGGNPPLYQSMGGEFCPNGMGGVLGANSTGLFPTPCVSARGASSSYGRRRRRSRSMAPPRRRRSSEMDFGRRRRRSKSMAPRRRRRSSEMDFGRRRKGKKGCRRVSKLVCKRGRRYNVAGSPCNIRSKRVCQSNPNCSYTRRGCRRRSGTVSKGLVFEGPSLQFGRYRRRRVVHRRPRRSMY
jgi:hypothetical protein